MSIRKPVRTIQARRTVEGGGFVVRRPFPTAEMPLFDPFLLLDELGPVEYAARKRSLKVAQLCRAQVVIEKNQVGIRRCGDNGNLFHLAGANQRVTDDVQHR